MLLICSRLSIPVGSMFIKMHRGYIVHAHSVHPSRMQFALDGSKVILHPKPMYIPKVPALSYGPLACELMSILPPPFASTKQQRLHNLCPVCALCTHINRTQEMRKSNQLFVCFANPENTFQTSILLGCGGDFPNVCLRLADAQQGARSLHQGYSYILVSFQRGFNGRCVFCSEHTFPKFYCLDVTARNVTQSVLSAGQGWSDITVPGPNPQSSCRGASQGVMLDPHTYVLY